MSLRSCRVAYITYYFFFKPWTPRSFLLYFVAILILTVFMLTLYIGVLKLELWPWYPPLKQWCEREDISEQMLHPVPDEVTIVTMFLDLGIFKKGEEMLSYHSPYKYRRWMRIFGRIANPVVAYMEREDDVQYFREIRSCLPSSLTKVIKIDRDNLPSFKHLSRISQIYSQPSYPKIFPNTVYPEYTCAMSAKYDVLEKSCIMNFYKTPYIAWADIGLFRGLEETDYKVFKLALPNKFNAMKVSFTEAWPLSIHEQVQEVMLKKRVWVSGSMVLATREKMLNFSHSYKRAVVELLNKGLSNTDQEVIHSMYTKKMRKLNQVDIDTYHCRQGQFNLWGPAARYFCLGYFCKDAWEKKTLHTKNEIT